MRKGIDGLATLIQDSFELDPYGDSIFLFVGWKKDRYKCLYFDGNGFALLYKRLDNGKLQWPKDEQAVRNLFQQELRWAAGRINDSTARSHSAVFERCILKIEELLVSSSTQTTYNGKNKTGRNVVKGMVNASGNQYEKLVRLLEEQLAHSNQQNKELSKQIEALTEQVCHLTKLLYGSKTEKSKYHAPDGQGSLFEDDPSFNETEHTVEQSQQTISYTVVRKARSKNEAILCVRASKLRLSIIIRKTQRAAVAKV